MKLQGLSGIWASASDRGVTGVKTPNSLPNLPPEGKKKGESAATGEQNHERREGVDGSDSAIKPVTGKISKEGQWAIRRRVKPSQR